MRSILLSISARLILCVYPVTLPFPKDCLPKIYSLSLPDIHIFLIVEFQFFQRLYFVHDMFGIGDQAIVNCQWQSHIIFLYEILLRFGDVAYEEGAYFMYFFIEVGNSDMGDIDERLHLEIFLDVVNRNPHSGWSDKLRELQSLLVWLGLRFMGVYYFFIYAIKHYYYHHLFLMSNCLKMLILVVMVVLAKSDGYCGKENCYEVLGVERDADENTIKKAFRELAKRYHPDKNRQEDTTELFQLINKAYEILTNQKARFKYDLHLQNPEESDYYHEYRYYQRKFIQNPQVHPLLVITIVLVLISSLQYIMRKQMYERAIMQITQGHDFKTKLNERCGNNKKIKDTIKEEMIEEISIEGGYSMPTYKDILLYKTVTLPITLCLALYGWSRWILKYYIKREEYTPQDQDLLTMKALSISARRWEHFEEQEKKMLIGRKLWIKENWKTYEQEMKEKWLEQLKESNPRKYQMVMKHMKKTQ